MSIKIFAAFLLFSLPGGLLFAGISIVICHALSRLNVKGNINSFMALGSMVFAEEYSLDGLKIEDRSSVIFNFSE